ncbi:ras GTPase-activating protein-binding protein 2-like [Trifolium medium]|uniref:Ras GTPase-activating protein-binding protein 2-like n=1 Tax=Trifolium medium TaxID=97028 RepID=A0A392LXD5_9FABA|nr:ras GTPase-activating protein-binding protein 2-like [Trifolium medium]
MITSDLDKIDEHIKEFNVDTVEIKSINSLNCWGLGVHLVVMGSIKLKKYAICRDFVQTMYLAPHGKKGEKRGYFILNDILHIITHHYYDVRDHSKPVLPLKSQDIDPRFLSESKIPPPPPPPLTVTDNGNLDEAKVEKIDDDLMSTMENRIEFPPLPRKQQPLRQRGFDPSVWKAPLAQDEASSSNSASVANADDTIHENIDAPKIEEPVIYQEEPSQISDKPDDSALPTSSTSTSRGRGIGRGRNNSIERGSGDRNKGKEIEEPVVVQVEPYASALPTSSTSRGRGRGRNNSSKRGSGDRSKGMENQNTD